MKAIGTLLFDEETRKQIKEHVLGYAKGVARSEIEATVKAEISRLAANMQQRFEANRWTFDAVMKDALKTLLTDRWSDIKSQIDVAVRDAVNAVVAEKMKNKTVWEAEKQEQLIRKLAAQEATKIVALNLPKDD